MVKTIHFKVTDDMYYSLVSVRAQLNLDTWEQLMNNIIQTNNPKQPEPTKQPEQPKQPTPTKQPTDIKIPSKIPTLDDLINTGLV